MNHFKTFSGTKLNIYTCYSFQLGSQKYLFILIAEQLTVHMNYSKYVIICTPNLPGHLMWGCKGGLGLWCLTPLSAIQLNLVMSNLVYSKFWLSQNYSEVLF